MFRSITLAALLLTTLALADEPKNPATPWGISSSSSSFKNHEEWFPRMAAAGVTTVRLFPEWRELEPTKGTWKWDKADLLVKNAAAHKLEINGILMGSAHGSKKAHAFPMDNLDDWSTYVSAVVSRYKSSIRYWEVWNEGNGGFNDDHHTTSDYAKLAIATYEAAHKVDPNVRVGLTVASFDAPYLSQTIRAMAKAGKPNSFDYLCIHPYEVADGLADPDGEVPFLWMTHTLREMLKACAPERAQAEIWITEVARRVEKRGGHMVTPTDAARALVKMYTMAIAQGIARTQWFEAQDPIGEDQGFGLLARDGKPRPGHDALKTLAARLGPGPKYLGWLTLGWHGRGYGFVFQGAAGPVLVAWMPAGLTDRSVTFAGDVQVLDPLTGTATPLKAGESLTFTDSPALILGLPADRLKEAQQNAAKKFPWGGDHSAAKVVRCLPGDARPGHGIFQVGRKSLPTVKFPDGSTGIAVRGDIGHPVSFWVHPTFANFQTSEYHVRVHVRRLGPGNVGMNLLYEVADSQGRAAYRNREQWFGTTADAGWQTHTWHVTDACFAKMWGNDFTIRPEQSVPFVIGKVEVSTVPFN